MNIQKKPGSRPDDLIRNGDIELTENELGNVSGGAGSDYLLTLDGIKGESQDDRHKDTIHVESFKKVK
jgi:hypothetical protein